MSVTHALTAARTVDPGDAIDHVVPRYAVAPRDRSELTSALREANQLGLAAVVATNRTKLSWGTTPSSYELAIDCRQLDPVLDHAPSDLVVRVSGSTALSSLQEVLAQHGQRLALDEMVGGSSIGGVISTGISGPLRYGFGAVRDLLIGLTVARADGVIAKSGGRVVKNVAGYDLGKLYTGAYGTLGVVLEAFFRLHPLPAAQRFVTAPLDQASEAEILAAVLASQVAPSAIEVHRDAPGAQLWCTVLVEGRPTSATARADAVASLLGGRSTVDAERPGWWAVLPGAVTVKLTSSLAALPSLLRSIDEITSRHDLPAALTGSAGVGVVFVGWSPESIPGDTDAGTPDARRPGAGRVDGFAEVLGALRAASQRCGGSAAVLRAPIDYRRGVDPWGPVGGLELMGRIKDQFDPSHLLSRGRFVGGI